MRLPFSREMSMKKVLIIGFVWVEPNSSAAGSRMMQLIQLFQKNNYQVHFATAASKTDFSDNLEQLNITTQHIELNSDSFDTYVTKVNPNMVLFDRFLAEEQFGWRVAQSCPNALKILDTEDLHCLRKTRHEVFKKNIEFDTNLLKNADITKREIASIYRCDLSLIISTYEMKLLKEVFHMDARILYYLPFLLNKIVTKEILNLPKFKDRQHFMTIGNFLHQPNYNMVLYLKETVWPLIKKQLPKAELHIYGAYVSQKVQQLHNKKEGFLVKGRADSVANVMQQARVCLAPIRFGAGIKGKFTDAMQNGLPSCTTTIGAEGMLHNNEWGGAIEDNPQNFAQKAVGLYTNQLHWEKAQQNGFDLYNTVFDKNKYENDFMSLLEMLQENVAAHRNQNFIGAMLQHHTLQSTKYLSKWIEAKNK